MAISGGCSFTFASSVLKIYLRPVPGQLRDERHDRGEG
jgi:hypothetical protein